MSKLSSNYIIIIGAFIFIFTIYYLIVFVNVCRQHDSIGGLKIVKKSVIYCAYICARACVPVCLCVYMRAR